MRMNLTLPGFGGGGKKKPANTGKIINKDPAKTPAEEAEDVFKKTVNPNTANTALYNRHTANAGKRTETRTMTGASSTVKDATTGEAIQRTGSTGVYRDSKSGGVHRRSALGMVSRALKRLTGN